MEFVIDFFLKAFPEHKNKNLSVSSIASGFSNKTYKLLTPEQKEFKVRIACHNDLISRENELLILAAVSDPNLLYYDKKTGNSIYKWIEGRTLQKTDLNKEAFKQIFELAQKYHNSCDSSDCGILVHNHFDHHNIANKDINICFTRLYKHLIDKHNHLPKYLTHNDISLKNLIINEKKEIFLIDYEWGRINTIYWDLGNFARESKLDKNDIQILSNITELNYSILIDFVFISAYYSLQLSYSFPDQTTIIDYRKGLNSQIDTYYFWIKKN